MDGARVAMHAIHQEFIVQVGAGSRPSGTNRADHVALFDARAFFDPQLV